MNAGVQSHAGAGTIAVVAREVGVTLRFGAKSHGLGKLVAQADSIYRAEVVQGAMAGAFVLRATLSRSRTGRNHRSEDRRHRPIRSGRSWSVPPRWQTSRTCDSH